MEDAARSHTQLDTAGVCVCVCVSFGSYSEEQSVCLLLLFCVSLSDYLSVP